MRHILASLLVLLGLSLPCAAVVAVDAANCNGGTEQYKTSSTTQTLTGVTITSGSNRALVVFINFDINGSTATPTVVSVIWDVAGANQALSAIAPTWSGAGGQGAGAQIWGAVGITAGASKTITMVTTNPQAVFLGACAFTGVNQTGGTTSFPGAQANGGVTTVTVPSATGDIVVNQGGGNGVAITGITGTTIYNDSTSGAVVNSYANYDAGSASVTIGATSFSSALAAVDIKAATGTAVSAPGLTQMGIGAGP